MINLELSSKNCRDGTLSMIASLNVLINYSQLILYLPSSERPGHVWGEAELVQGFAWSPGIVSLSVPEHAMVCAVGIEAVSSFKMSPDAISCIRVPFTVDENPVFAGSVFFYEPVDIEFGNYSLYYEVIPGIGTAKINDGSQDQVFDIDYILKISLAQEPDSDFKILKAGGAVHSDKVLSRLSELA